MIDWDKIKFEVWNKRFGEGTNFDLDYGKLLIIGLLVYHIFFKPLFIIISYIINKHYILIFNLNFII